MNRVYYAHSGKKVDKSDWQLLSDHLVKVACISKNNARYFDGKILAEAAGLLHDIGKYTEAYQARLEGGKRVDHATAGAKISVRKWGHYGKLLAYVVAGHHAGLANGIDAGKERSNLEERLKKSIPEPDELWMEEIALRDELSFPSFASSENPGFQFAFLIRMIFSCLVDADFLDTEAFYLELEGKTQVRGDGPPLQKLKHSLDGYLENLTSKVGSNSPGTVNKLRKEILDYSRERAVLPPGLFSLSVPTGGGKTLTSMAFALDHAVEHQLRRVIYVIPFTSIIEQNAKVFRDVFSTIGDDVVLEHHSAYDDSKFDDREETKDKLRLAMENWDAPVIVTTAVQFFESLFADRTSKCRKLHNISGSVIILDEAQMLPLKLLRPTMAAIDELARNYQCSIVLCTATQPALLETDNFYNGFKNVREIAPEPSRLYTALDRVTVKYIGEQTDEQLAEKLNQNKQILIIVNNRRHARVLFDLASDEINHYHLTTLMCAKHRRKVLDEILKKLKSGQPCKVISTSLIEAGVDADFPIVMRAESGLDSIAQAAGRCNREGLRAKDDSKVLIFQSPQWKAPAEIEQYAASMRHVLRNHEGDLLAPVAIKSYFEDVYWRKDDELDSKKLLKAHRDHHAKLTFPFQTIARDYRMIENSMYPIIVPYDKEAEELIEKLRYSEFVGKIARKLQPYLVQLPEKAINALSTVSLETIQHDKFGDQFKVLINSDLYDKKTGLNWDDPYFIRQESLICN